MEVVCKAVCGLGEASAPKFSHDFSPFFQQGVLPPAPPPGKSFPWTLIREHEIPHARRGDSFDIFCNIRNTPIKSDRSIFLSSVFLIIYLIFLPSLRKSVCFCKQGAGDYSLRVLGSRTAEQMRRLPVGQGLRSKACLSRSPEVFGLRVFTSCCSPSSSHEPSWTDRTG